MVLPEAHGWMSCWVQSAGSKSLICLFPDLLPPPCHGGPTSILLVLLEGSGFLQLCPEHCNSQAITDCSPLPLPERSVLLESSPVQFPWVRAALGTFLLLLPPLWPNSHFISSSGVLESPLRKAGFLQILNHVWVSAQVSTLQVFFSPIWMRGLWTCSLSTLVPHFVLKSVCLLLDAYVSETPPRSLGIYMVLDPTTPTRTLLFVGGYLFCCLKRGDKKEECLTLPWC